MKFAAPKARRVTSIKRFFVIATAVACSVVVATLGLAVITTPKVSAAGFVTSADTSVTEGNNAVFTFTIPYSNSNTYTYSTIDGTANSVSNSPDYIASSDVALEFSCPFTTANQQPCTASVSIPTFDDTVYEPAETFSITVSSNNNDGYTQEEGTWTATINDNDPAPVTTPPATITPTPTPTPPPVTTTPAPTPRPTPTHTTIIPDPIPDPTPKPEPTVTTVPEVLGTTTTDPPAPAVPEPPKETQRSKFVQSVLTPKDLKPTFKKVVKAFVIAALLVLLIMFPADVFNSTLQSNYDEIIGWFKMDYIGKLHRKMQLHRVPIAVVLSIFAGLVTLLNTQLSPDFGFNRASGALLLGMFIALTFAATVYDLSREIYLKKRFGVSGKLRAHALGLGVGALFVTVSRLAHFVPGYLYGLFTGLIFKQKGPTDEQDGEGLAMSSVLVLVLAIAGWFALIPVRSAASQPDASFAILVAEAALATLWVSALGMIVFSLAPMRFMYGEQVKKWNKYAWAGIYGSGMLLFVYTLLDPNQSVYGKSGTASWLSVLSLFIGFAIFSFAFWGYFRFRPARTQPVASAQ